MLESSRSSCQTVPVPLKTTVNSIPSYLPKRKINLSKPSSCLNYPSQESYIRKAKNGYTGINNRNLSTTFAPTKVVEISIRFRFFQFAHHVLQTSFPSNFSQRYFEMVKLCGCVRYKQLLFTFVLWPKPRGYETKTRRLWKDCQRMHV